MTEKPADVAPRPEESEALAAFRATLTAITEEYADNRYPTYGIRHDSEENTRKIARTKELRLQLVDTCAQALATLPDTEATVQVIHEVVIRYQYGAGALLLAGNDVGEFWRELTLAIAKKFQER
jgi:hypothetical protein